VLTTMIISKAMEYLRDIILDAEECKIEHDGRKSRLLIDK
jgi:hypothetical protein